MLRIILMSFFVNFVSNFNLTHTFAIDDSKNGNIVEEGKDYEGPQVESYDIETVYSEKAKIKAKIKATKWLQYENKDTVYPEGIHVQLFDKEEKLSATITADYVRFDSKKNVYFIKNNVVVKNEKRDETLTTEELEWFPDDKRIYSSSFVNIETKDVKLIGKGLDAKEDLSEYTIHETRGTIAIKDKTNTASS